MRIAPVSPSDSAEYLRYRLSLVGCERDLFPQDCVALLHEATLGAHRDLDRLAALALRDSARRKRKLVETDLVAAILDNQARAA